MERRTLPWHAEVRALLEKDLKSEFRTRVAINAILLFSLTTLFLVSYAIGPYKLGKADRPAILSAWMWVIFFFSAMSGMSRVFVKEEETKTAPLLRLASRPSAVFVGKFACNFLLIIGVSVIVTPLYVILMEFSIDRPLWFALSIGFGLLGMTSGVTLIAAIVAKAGMKGTLFSILSFPVIIPVLLVSIEATSTAASGPAGNMVQPLSVMISFTGAMLILSLLLFEKVWLE